MLTENEFLEKFKNIFDETDISQIQFDTKFKELDEWSSLTVLSLIVMCEEEFLSSISPNEIEKSVLVEDLFKYTMKNLDKNV